MKTATIVFALLFLTGCGTSGLPDPSLQRANAQLTVSDLAPAPGTALNEMHVLSATVDYSIENFQPGVDYYLSPVFASAEGNGKTFNMTDSLRDNPRLTTAQGTVALHQSIRREILSGKLARPVQMWLYVMERSGKRTSKVIGMSGPYEYELAP